MPLLASFSRPDSLVSRKAWLRNLLQCTSEPKKIGVPIEVKPHAYDPAANPELFDGVPGPPPGRVPHRPYHSRDPVIFVAIFFFVIGIVTFGLGCLLYGLMPAITRSGRWSITA